MVKSKKAKGFWQDEVGATTIIEGAFIFPLVFLVLAVLIFLGLFTLQRASLYTQAERIATYAAKVQAIPGYEHLYKPVGPQNADMPGGVDSIGGGVVTMQQERDPYRYWNFGGIDNASEMEGYLSTLIDEHQFLKLYSISCEVEGDGIPMFNQGVTVSVTATSKLPSILKMFRPKGAMDFTVWSRSSVMDTSEFVRNTNMAFDLTEFLLEKFEVGDKTGVFMQRMKDMGAKWFNL